MPLDEIVLPETKPETEWIRGRAVQKVSPFRTHSRVQTVLAALLDSWSRGRGEVGTEWRFRVAPPGEVRRPLAPDVAFVKRERLRGFTADELEAPPFAPTVAVEILSPGDRRKDVASKIDVYLRAGTELVLVIDPRKRAVVLHDPAGSTSLTGDETLRHEALPGFELPLRRFFEDALKLTT